MNDIEDLKSHRHGHPEAILKLTGLAPGEKIQFFDKSLDTILLHKDVKDRKICVVSIVGAFRKGKSFLLDFCLRYLYAHYTSINTAKHGIVRSKFDWHGDDSEPLVGFSWRSGVNGVTTGILFWSDVFLYDAENGDKIAIVLMDTQGLFDRKSDSQGDVIIFALSNLFSSVQIYNLSQNIQEDQLEYLRFATEYAKIVDSKATNQSLKPFQTLQFLIRDWCSPSDYPYGSVGGQAFLEHVLEIKNDQKPDQKKLRESLRDCYEKIQCCLFPYPGKIAACSAAFDGCLSQIDADFVEQLKDFIPQILGYKDLQLKKINGIDATAGQCYDFLTSYVELFNNSDELPEVSTMHESTLDNYFRKMVRKCLSIYIASATVEIQSVQDLEGLAMIHGFCKKEALQYFHDKVQICNDPEKQRYHKEILSRDIEIFHRKIKEFMEKLFRKKKFEAIMNHVVTAGKVTAAVAAFAMLAFLKLAK